MPSKQILLVLEDGVVPHESVYHAMELSKRMGCPLSILMLMDDGPQGANKEEDGKKIEELLSNMRSEGVDVSVSINHGEKVSGLLKHIALMPSLYAVVWGGKDYMTRVGKSGRGEPWFERVRDAIQCPIVIPKARK